MFACLYRKGSLITCSGVAQDLHFGGAWFEPRETLGCSDRFIVIFVSLSSANAGILYPLCGDCLPGPPRAGSGPGGKKFFAPAPGKGVPAKNLYAKSEILPVAE